MWYSSAHTPFFIIANLLSADEVLHCLAIWVAPKRSFLKTKVKTTVWQLQNKSFLFDSVCFTSKFSMKISFILIQRIILKNIFKGGHRQGIMLREGQQAWEAHRDSLVQNGKAEFETKPCHHASYSSQNSLTIFLMLKENIQRCKLFVFVFHKILNSIQYVPSFNFQKSFNVSLWTWSPFLGSVMDREEL